MINEPTHSSKGNGQPMQQSRGASRGYCFQATPRPPGFSPWFRRCPPSSPPCGPRAARWRSPPARGSGATPTGIPVEGCGRVCLVVVVVSKVVACLDFNRRWIALCFSFMAVICVVSVAVCVWFGFRFGQLWFALEFPLRLDFGGVPNSLH